MLNHQRITAVGLVADLAQSIGSQMGNYWENLLQLLGNALTNADSKKLKPAVVSAFGDIATAIGPDFAPYLEFVLRTCTEAGNIQPQDGSIDTLDFVFNVRNQYWIVLLVLLRIYKSTSSFSTSNCHHITIFTKVTLDPQMSSSESVARSAAGLLGDIAAMYPNGEFKQVFTEEWVTDFIKELDQIHCLIIKQRMQQGGPEINKKTTTTTFWSIK